jgi:hypothetical protein
MRRRGLLLLAATAPLAGVRVALAADAIERVRARLDVAPLLRGQFVQTRRLSGFRNPLRSAGEFVLVRSRGLLWATREPFASTLVVTPERIESRDAQGRRIQVLDARSEPALRTVNTLLLATLAADLAPLRARFAVEAEAIGDAGWRLTLTPTDPAVAAQYTRIALAGARFVASVRLDERNGDSTEIAFDGVHAGAALSATEDALLAGRGG